MNLKYLTFFIITSQNGEKGWEIGSINFLENEGSNEINLFFFWLWNHLPSGCANQPKTPIISVIRQKSRNLKRIIELDFAEFPNGKLTTPFRCNNTKAENRFEIQQVHVKLPFSRKLEASTRFEYRFEFRASNHTVREPRIIISSYVPTPPPPLYIPLQRPLLPGESLGVARLTIVLIELLTVRITETGERQRKPRFQF